MTRHEVKYGASSDYLGFMPSLVQMQCPDLRLFTRGVSHHVHLAGIYICLTLRSSSILAITSTKLLCLKVA